MSVLLVELHGNRRGSVLPRRVLIGRRSMNHLVIDHPAVSRMHAWIEGEGDRYYLSDAGSRSGTRVNGQRIVARHLLGDEDEIAIGPAKLIFLAESRLRSGVAAIDLTSPPKVTDAEEGILFDCPSCTAPLWVTQNFAGGKGQCKYCGQDLVVPGGTPAKMRSAVRPAPPRAAAVTALGELPEVKASIPSPGTPGEGKGEGLEPSAVNRRRGPKDPHPSPLPEYRERENHAAPHASSADARTFPAAARQTPHGEHRCSVCQSAISAFEEQTSCPSCALVFHADCWAENYGCSAYGCAQVNALAPAQAHDHGHSGQNGHPGQNGGAEMPAGVGAPDISAPDGDFEKPKRFPWEFLLLAGSVFSALAGALTFGVPSLALAGGTVTYMARTRGNGNAHRGVVMLAAALALIGVIAGIPVSWFLYFGGPHT